MVSKYSRRFLVVAFFWSLIALTVYLLWELPGRWAVSAAIFGVVVGLALGHLDAEKLPVRLNVARTDLSSGDGISRIVGRLLFVWALLLLSREFLVGKHEAAYAYTAVLFAFPVVCVTYSTYLFAMVVRQERERGEVIRESTFPGFIGLPQVLRGTVVEIRDASEAGGTAVVAGELWDARSATGEQLVAGQGARIVGVDDLTLLVTQDRDEDA